MDIVVWLRSLGLGKYEAAFRENEIDETVLPGLTRKTLKELGVAASGTGASCSMPSLRSAYQSKRQAASADSAAVRRVSSRSRRTPPSHSDVLRLGRLNGPIGAHGP